MMKTATNKDSTGIRDSARPTESGRKKPGVGRTRQLYRQRTGRLQRLPQRRSRYRIPSGWEPLLWPAGENQSGNLLGWRQGFWWFPGANFPLDIISRNLTPDKTGLPEGGHTFAEFVQIIRTGKDFDRLHPTCTGMPNANCVPPPFNGDLLQIMPWPVYKT
jgi:hypothetical protein